MWVSPDPAAAHEVRVGGHADASMDGLCCNGHIAHAGVRLHKSYSTCARPWIAYIKVDGKQKHLGSFATEVQVRTRPIYGLQEGGGVVWGGWPLGGSCELVG